MLKQDFLTEDVKELSILIFSSIFGIKEEDVDDFVKNYHSDKYDYERLKKLLDENKINEAEDILFNNVVETDRDYFEMAVVFFYVLNQKEPEELEKCNYSKNEILEGLNDMAKLFNLDYLTSIFL